MLNCAELQAKNRQNCSLSFDTGLYDGSRALIESDPTRKYPNEGPQITAVKLCVFICGGERWDTGSNSISWPDAFASFLPPPKGQHYCKAATLKVDLLWPTHYGRMPSTVLHTEVSSREHNSRIKILRLVKTSDLYFLWISC
jgi:hypothetical protein